MSATKFVLGGWLKKLRKERGLSRQQVSELCDGRISQQYIHFIEIGKATNIGSDKLKALSEGLNVPIEVLQQALFGEQEPQIPLVGRAAAGQAAHLAEEEYAHEVLDYIRASEGNRRLFAVEIMGDSMAPRIEHGDLAMAETWKPGDLVYPGRIYLFKHGKKHNAKVTCKYLVEYPDKPGKYWLVAENVHLFQPVPLDETYQILGRVVEVRKTETLFRPLLKEVSKK